MLLKAAMFCVVGLVAGVGHYWFVGSQSMSVIVRLLAGLGGVGYIEYEAARGNSRRHR